MLTAIVLITGDRLRVEQPAAELADWIVSAPDAAEDGLEWIFVLDGPQWKKTLAPSRWPRDDRRICTVLRETACNHFGVLANHGLQAARGDYVALVWPGCDMEGRVAQWRVLAALAEEKGLDAAAGAPSPGERQTSPFDSWLSAPRQAIRGYHRGWLQLQHLVPLATFVVRRTLFEEEGGFSPSILLQRHAGWEWTLRASRRHTLEMAAETEGRACRWAWHNYPLEQAAPISGDLAARLLGQGLLPVRAVGEGLSVNADGVAELMRDLDAVRAVRLARYLRPARRWVPGLAEAWDAIAAGPAPRRPAPVRWSRPLRVAVVGGVHEPAHNQLCFFNYFEKISGCGLVSWRALLDTAAVPADVTDADLVIFSRIRSEPGCRLLDYCVARGIKTLYMLDDNWLWIGHDVPETYGEMFKPGAPSYENFLHCCRTADCVLTYSPILAEDLVPNCRRLARLPTNIDLGQFPRRARETNRPPLLGYVGSTRWVPGAFDGLVRVAEERPDVRLFIMTNKPPEALSRLPGRQIIIQPYVYSYERYAQIVCEASPDILVAPLRDCRYQNSKCPNKYLEITAVGAAGVYSRVEPYLSVIRAGENGLFADDALESWREAILRLVDDVDLRRRIAAAALAHVEREYNTESVLPEFLGLLESVAGVGSAGAEAAS